MSGGSCYFRCQSGQAGRQPPCRVHESDVPGGTPELQSRQVDSGSAAEPSRLWTNGDSKIPRTWRCIEGFRKLTPGKSRVGSVRLNICERSA